MPEVFKQMYTERLNCKQIWLERLIKVMHCHLVQHLQK